MPSSNPSVAKFYQLMALLPKELREEIGQELIKQGAATVALMRRAVPVGKTGNLQKSIRMEPAGLLRIAIRAGGPLTTKPVRSGQTATYDYALATEHGTTQEAAQPFFYPSYRLQKAVIKRGINKSIRKVVSKLVAAG